MLTRVLPEVPPETARLAHAAFNERNLYLQVGDALCALTADFGSWACGGEGALAEQAAHLLALITIFQYIELLTDHQANQALRQRLDWKYALHLPPTFPAAPHLQTCEFRRRLLTNPAEMAALEALFVRIRRHGLSVAPTGAVCPEQVVRTVCAVNRLDRLAAAVAALLEYLAAYHCDWLRVHTQPGWYLRYGKDSDVRSLPSDPGDWSAHFERIGQDGFALLHAIHATQSLAEGETALKSTPALRALRSELRGELRSQFDEHNGRLRLRSQNCSDCLYSGTAG